MRVEQPLDLAAHRLGFGGVDADAGAALAGRHVEHVEGAAVARDDRRHARRVGLSGGAAAARLVARRAAEHFDAAGDGVGRVLRLDGAREGRIGEHQRAGEIAGPDRRGQGVDQRAQRFHFAGEFFVAGVAARRARA